MSFAAGACRARNSLANFARVNGEPGATDEHTVDLHHRGRRDDGQRSGARGLFRLAAHLAKDGIEAEHLTAKGAKAAAVVEAGSAAVGEEAQAAVKTAERKGTSEASALVEDVKKTGEGVKKVGEVLKEGASEGETGVGEKTPWWAYALGIVLLPLGAVFVIGQYVIRPVMIVWRIGGAVWRFFRRKAPANADSGLVSPEVGAQS